MAAMGIGAVSPGADRKDEDLAPSLAQNQTWQQGLWGISPGSGAPLGHISPLAPGSPPALLHWVGPSPAQRLPTAA